MAEKKFMRGDTTVILFPQDILDSQQDWETVTAAEMNDAISRNAGWNISCAITEEYALNQTGSETDSSRTICERDASQTRVAENIEANLPAFVSDYTETPVAVFDLAQVRMRGAGHELIIARRVDGTTRQSDAPAGGQNWSFYPVKTADPSWGLGDRENVIFNGRFQQNGEPMLNKTLA